MFTALSQSMDKINLLEIQVDKLFQTHSINEIDELQKRIQYEIERKKEDLRAMVGEKYRDLIQAADTIKQMKITSHNIESKIKAMNREFEMISQKQAHGYNIEVPSAGVQKYKDAQTMAAQTKLLLDLSEEIWTCLDDEDYYTATQLFILARHIYAGLQLQSGSNSFISLKPVITMQWNVISNMKGTIEKACNEKLQVLQLNEKVATSCLLSLYLLEYPTLVDLLKTFIKLRSDKSLEATLKFSLSEDAMKGSLRDEVEKRIIDSLKVILKTIDFVQVCFVGENGGTVIENLNALLSPNASPLIKIINWKQAYLLPTSVTSYRITSKQTVAPISSTEVAACVSNWLEWVKSFINDKVSSLLANITNVSTLHKIMDEAAKIETPNDWQKTCFQLSIEETDIWRTYFQPLFTRRIREIIDMRMKKVSDGFETQIVDDISRVSNEGVSETEADLNWYVWKDIIGETVIETRSEVIDVMNSLMKGMWLQDHGITPNLLKLYQNVDSELSKLLQELDPFIREDSSNFLDREEDSYSKIYGDKSEIENYLRTSAGICIERMLNFIQNSLFTEPKFQTTELQRKTVAIYTARFCQSFAQLVPNFRSCVMIDKSKDFKEDDELFWNDVCHRLKECRNDCWLKWIDIVVGKIGQLTVVLPKEFTIEANIDFLLMQWDSIKIHQKDENGADIESTIKIPCGPSLKLQQYLYQVIRILDEVIPVTLPKCIHDSFVERLVDITLLHYEKAISESETNINQKCALQLLMDVRHLTLMLVTRDNKKGMELSQSICERLRQKIDPFDYDVFYPYIQTNVRRSVQKVQTLFGTLITHSDHLNSVLGSKPIQSGGTADKAPNLVALCSQDGAGQWFTLLPITAPVTVNKRQEKLRKKPVPSISPSKPSKSDISELMSSSLPMNLAQARSGAAAFFESMTSEWFSQR